MPPSRALTEPVAEPTTPAEAGVDVEPFTEPLADTPVLVAGTDGVTVVSALWSTEAVLLAGRSARAWLRAASTALP